MKYMYVVRNALRSRICVRCTRGGWSNEPKRLQMWIECVCVCVCTASSEKGRGDVAAKEYEQCIKPIVE